MLTRLRKSARPAAAVAFAVAALVTTVPAATATPSPPSVVLPDDDPFYDVPSHVDAKRDGTVLRWRRLPAHELAIPAPAQVWQLLYKTRDNAGKATATVGTLLVPTARWTGPGERPLLSYQTPEDGLATFCAPSYLLRAGSKTDDPASEGQARFDRGQVADAVGRGWAVMVPDYEGPRSQFLGADAAAHGVLDGIRAARSFAPARVHRDAPVGMWGYSGGGLATASAAQKQSLFAPELDISAVVLGGVAADLNAALASVSGQAFSGWIPFAVAAVRNAVPRAGADRYVNEHGRALADRYAHGCAGAPILGGPHFAAVGEFEAWPGSLTSGPFRDLLHRLSPVGFGGTPAAPVLMYHGTEDELLPVSAARELAAQYRARGADVVLTEHAGQGHSSAQTVGVADAVAFLTHRFAH
ncbi:Secretory lipase [Lentzea fradiae]|uniref:Secretory lipase n=1 Tax=Lentzea fradiae TaxID=200378 RepID=A0A1G7KEL5_9PSEU|nr:lipase family protein [Lentzea fradiae]SDF35434.1 Secretory lipase [Lentzea fradiae]